MRSFELGYLELAQPVKVLNDPQMRIPRPKPMVLIIGTTAMFPVDTKHRKNGLLPIQQMHFYVKLVFFFLTSTSVPQPLLSALEGHPGPNPLWC